MSDSHLDMLSSGVKQWNEWRAAHPGIIPNLRKAQLVGANLRGANLHRADLRHANLQGADLYEANLSGAHLTEAGLRNADLTKASLRRAYLHRADLTAADLTETELTEAAINRGILVVAILHRAKLAATDLTSSNLTEADLRKTDLGMADLTATNLRGVDLSEANLTGANLTNADLFDADLSNALVGQTIFADLDLRTVKGLTSLRHLSASTVGIDTLYRSSGKIPENFLRGCGVPDVLLEYLPSLVNAQHVIQYFSCFISYSSSDEPFVERLYSRMRDKHLRVWYAPKDLKGGKKLHPQIDQAIRLHEKFIVVLSENSIRSEWVKTEIRKAHQAEQQSKSKKLFPIRLMDWESLKKWSCFDADIGKDLAVEVRDYHIPDFTNWKDHDAFEKEFAELLRDLQAAETEQSPLNTSTARALSSAD